MQQPLQDNPPPPHSPAHHLCPSSLASPRTVCPWVSRNHSPDWAAPHALRSLPVWPATLPAAHVHHTVRGCTRLSFGSCYSVRLYAPHTVRGCKRLTLCVAVRASHCGWLHTPHHTERGTPVVCPHHVGLAYLPASCTVAQRVLTPTVGLPCRHILHMGNWRPQRCVLALPACWTAAQGGSNRGRRTPLPPLGHPSNEHVHRTTYCVGCGKHRTLFTPPACITLPPCDHPMLSWLPWQACSQAGSPATWAT